MHHDSPLLVINQTELPQEPGDSPWWYAAGRPTRGWRSSASTRLPSNQRWGIIERLDDHDLLRFIDIAFEAIRLAASIVAETSIGTPTPLTKEDRDAFKAARDARGTDLHAIRATASIIQRIATRIVGPVPGTGNEGKDTVH